jgi:hypothetical protein
VTHIEINLIKGYDYQIREVVNFTIINITDNYIYLQLYFKDPIEVSSSLVI